MLALFYLPNVAENNNIVTFNDLMHSYVLLLCESNEKSEKKVESFIFHI